jgi:hypothetical protein
VTPDDLRLADLHHAAAAARRLRRGLPLPWVVDARSFDVHSSAYRARPTRDSERSTRRLVSHAALAILIVARRYSGPSGGFGPIAGAAARAAVAEHMYRLTAPASVSSHARKARVKLDRVPLNETSTSTPTPVPDCTTHDIPVEGICNTLDVPATAPVSDGERLRLLAGRPGLLTAKQRCVIELRLDGLSLREIARVMGSSARTTGTISCHLRAAAKRLRKAAQDAC